jgi:putative endonuclease
MADPRHATGRSGEQLAEAHLRRLGYRSIAANFKTPVGELDLVMHDGDTIVFVEVKTRTDRRFAEPHDAVTAAKMAKLSRAAAWFVQRRGWSERPCRFDVVTIITGAGPQPQIEHFREAFVPGW